MTINTPSNLQPNSKFTFSVAASSESIVSLIAVDQRNLISDIENTNLKYSRFHSIFESLKQDKSSLTLRPEFVDLVEFDSFILSDAKHEEICLSMRFGSDDEEERSKSEVELPETSIDQQQASHEGEPRNIFPQTWIFDIFKTDSDGKFTLQGLTPDSVTSWAVSGISFNANSGLKFSNHQVITVSRQFFVDLDLPYSIRFGEILKIEALIFNYLIDHNDDLEVDVVLSRPESSDDFEFIDKLSGCTSIPDSSSSKQEHLKIPVNSVASVSFLIRSLKVGRIELKLKAHNEPSEVSDEVEKSLIVEHEGISHYHTKSVPIDLRKGEPFELGFNLPIPAEAVWSSIKIEGELFGDLIGPTLLNPDHLM